MAGYGLTKKHHLATVLENNLISKGLNVKVINASVAGDTSAGGLNRLNWIFNVLSNFKNERRLYDFGNFCICSDSCWHCSELCCLLMLVICL